jgi:hypothetical protein
MRIIVSRQFRGNELMQLHRWKSGNIIFLNCFLRSFLNYFLSHHTHEGSSQGLYSYVRIGSRRPDSNMWLVLPRSEDIVLSEHLLLALYVFSCSTSDVTYPCVGIFYRLRFGRVFLGCTGHFRSLHSACIRAIASSNPPQSENCKDHQRSVQGA